MLVERGFARWGLSYRSRGLALGAALLGLIAWGPSVAHASHSFTGPTNYGAGVSYTHVGSGVTAACDVNLPSTSYTNVRTGVEWSWKHLFALRGGYRAELGAPSDDALSGPSFGAGLGARGMWFDYGYLLSGNEGGQHRLAVTLHPSRLGWKSDPFDQKSMPREFDSPSLVGPPAPTNPPAKPAQKR